MKSLKTLLQEVTAGIKAWANANFSLGTHVHGNVTNDGKVGTTANVPLITGTGGVITAGAFGNQANTFCEGNDSRLSDARTPVAHTHGKADITDLFNSANTWTSLNTYNGMILLKSSSDVAEQFKQKLPKDVSVSTDALVRFNTLTDSEDHNVIVEALGHWANYVSKSVTLKYKNDSTKQGVINFRLESNGSGLFYPQSPFECYLGNSSNQWKSVYAQSYYYNGTAWGLDKANEWTGENTFVSSFSKRNNAMTLGTTPAEVLYNSLFFKDKNDTLLASLDQQFDTDGSAHFVLRIAPNQSGATRVGAWEYIHDGINRTMTFNATLCPVSGYHALGTSTYKWTSLNGINPGALSLPNVNAVTGSSNTQLQDISGDLVQDQYFNCYFTPRMDGWAYIALDCSGASIISGFSSYTVSVKTSRSFANALYTQSFTKNENSFAELQILFPVTANKEITLEFTFAGFSVFKAYVIPAQGNV